MTWYDAIIIGAGQAGPSLAVRLASTGNSVALVERHLFGGTCVNTGCMPTKTLVASARAAHIVRRASDFGIDIDGDVTIDFAKVQARANAVARKARDGVEGWLDGSKCDILRGHAQFLGPDTLRVGEAIIKSRQIFINVGGRALVPDISGIDDVPFLTNTSILALDRLPRHLVIIGGSYIGLEFAQIYRRLGSEVTVVEKGPRLIAREDDDISAEIKNILEGEGIRFRMNADCIRVERHIEGVAVGVDCNADSSDSIGSHIMLAVGRRPNTDGLGLENAGILTDARGYIIVDDQLKTNVPGIWALGDCNGRGSFTHTAYNDFEIVAANIIDGGSRSLSERISAYALYIDPPLARVGMTETEARKTGRPLLYGYRPMARVGRAIERGETLGFMKIIVDAESKQVLGAAILGIEGDEAIHGIIGTMHAGLPYTYLQQTVPIHPTVSELIPTMLGELKADAAMAG